MVRSIQPEWICGPVPPGDGRHGQAIEMIAGVYAVHVLDQQRYPRMWYESFRKIWHRGRHRRDFDKTYRGARPDDHDYYTTHYEPGRKALAHHVQKLADLDAWRRRKAQNDHVVKIMKHCEQIEERRDAFQNLERHKREQKDLCCKAERELMKLAGITDIPENAPRARDMPQFNPQQIGSRGDALVQLGIGWDPQVFHPEFTNLYKLDRYLKNLDSVKRGLLQGLKKKPGRVPLKELYSIPDLPVVDPANVAAAQEVKQIKEYENRLDALVDEWRRKEALKPHPMLSTEAAIGEDSVCEEDYQKYGW